MPVKVWLTSAIAIMAALPALEEFFKRIASFPEPDHTAEGKIRARVTCAETVPDRPTG